MQLRGAPSKLRVRALRYESSAVCFNEKVPSLSMIEAQSIRNLTRTYTKSKSNAWVSSVGTVKRAVVQEILLRLRAVLLDFYNLTGYYLTISRRRRREYRRIVIETKSR